MAQIWNIVTKFVDNIICLVRVLMSSRTIPAYRAVLAHLKALCPNLAPMIVHCDFEVAEISAWRLEFPQAFGSTAKDEGLAPLAKENEFVLSTIAALCAVPMLPKNLMWAGVLEIWNEVETNGYWHVQMWPIFEHFERYWLPRRDELCVFNAPSRTNNCSESDNRAIATMLPQNRPNCWHLIGGFKQLEHIAMCDRTALQRLQPVTGGRKWKTAFNDSTVERAVRMLRERQITLAQYLHRVSHVVMAGAKQGLGIRVKDQEENKLFVLYFSMLLIIHLLSSVIACAVLENTS
ncbi:uncharacterized protein LOC127750394 [Frankliniella occidentalis]|uniref:Uncharacterized protein LOC127750394 n=1 Tax=Frankliniella occidentalis TaxID=133901 RepID=A0A9C6X2J1_FRAOC|nr:uncharacterized protein LOC127750394 [Frankliniella occidentalis]